MHSDRNANDYVVEIHQWGKLGLFHIIIERKSIHYLACRLEILLSKKNQPSTYGNHGFGEARTQNFLITSGKNNCFGIRDHT